MIDNSKVNNGGNKTKKDQMIEKDTEIQEKNGNTAVERVDNQPPQEDDDDGWDTVVTKEKGKNARNC